MHAHFCKSYISHFRKKKCFIFHYILSITADESENEVSINLYFEGQNDNLFKGPDVSLASKCANQGPSSIASIFHITALGSHSLRVKDIFFHTLYLHVSVVISDVQICKLGSSLAKKYTLILHNIPYYLPAQILLSMPILWENDNYKMPVPCTF